MEPQANSAAFKHDAFISYSRQNESFADKLEKALESYRPPRQLGLPRRYLNVFRDKRDFKAGEYHEGLETNLKDSAKLLVICSPAARKSTYVDDEIRRFSRLRGAQHIIPVLLSGIPNNEARAGQEEEMAFPQALCEAMQMPLAVNYLGFDVRKDKPGKGIYADGWFTILADIYEITRSEMEQREKKRRARARRIVTVLVSGSFAVLSVLLAFALVSRRQALAARNDAITAQLAETRQKEIAESAKKDAETERDRAVSAEAKTKEALDRETIARNLADEKRKEAEAEKARANEALRAIYTENGRQELLNDRPMNAAVYLNAAYEIPRTSGKSVDTSTLLFLLGQSLRSIDSPPLSLQHQRSVDFARFSPDGTKVVTVANLSASAIIWDAKTGQQLGTLVHSDGHPVLLPEFSPDGELILTRSWRHNVAKLWEVKIVKEIASMEHQDYVYSAEFSPDGKKIVTASRDATARVWSVETHQLLRSLKHGGEVQSARFSIDGRKIVTASYDKTARIWDADTGAELKCFSHKNYVDFAEFLPDGKRIVTQGWDDPITVWDATSVKPVVSFGEAGHLNSIDVSLDGSRVATASFEKAVVWDVRTGKEIASLKHADDVNSARFSDDGKKVVTADDDFFARVWDVSTGKILASFPHKNVVKAATFSNDGLKVVTASEDETVKIWDIAAESRPARQISAILKRKVPLRLVNGVVVDR